jgi:magnesium transporter
VVIVDCAVYEDGARRPGTLSLDDVPDACHRENAFVWIGLHEPTEDEFDAVAREFELHELAVEDAIKAHQRPKIESYGDTTFCVLKTARYMEKIEAVEIGEIQMFVGQGFIVVVRHGEATPLGDVRREVERRPDLLRFGPAAVAHAILDRVVDDYLPVIAGLDSDIQEVEFQVFSESRADNPVERIYKLKREVLELHDATFPLIEPVEIQLRRVRVPDELLPYFRDAQDHLLKVVDRIDTYRDLLNSILEANLTRVSVQQNQDMRKISAWVAIAAVPTAIAGIYGMNFEHMPELTWTGGYPFVLVLMAVLCGFLYLQFRRSGWL